MANPPISDCRPVRSKQVERTDDRWKDGALKGGYWFKEPGPNAEAAIVAMGALMPEALAAWEELSADLPGLGLLAVTSPDLLHRGWTAAQAGAVERQARAEPCRATAVALRAGRRPRHPVRRSAGFPELAWRRSWPAGGAAGGRAFRPDRKPGRTLRGLPPRRRSDHRGMRIATAANRFLRISLNASGGTRPHPLDLCSAELDMLGHAGHDGRRAGDEPECCEHGWRSRRRHRRPDAWSYRQCRRAENRARRSSASACATEANFRRLRSLACPMAMQDDISTSGRSATSSPMPSRAPSPRPTMCWSPRSPTIRSRCISTMRSRRQSEFGKPLVNSIYTFGLMVGVSVSDTTLGTLVANLGYDKLIFPAPVFVGDTLRSESECLEVRESKSRPNAGIVTWEHRSFNQRGEMVCKCTPLGAPPEEAGVTHLRASTAQLAVRPGGQQQEDDEGAGERRRTRSFSTLRTALLPRAKADRPGDADACCPSAATASPQRWLQDQPDRHRRASRKTLMRSRTSTSTGSFCPRPRAAMMSPISAAALAPRSLPIHAIVTETAASLFGLLSYREC